MKIVSGVHKIPGVRWSSAYLMDNVRLAVVDTGPPWSGGKVLWHIRSIGRNPADLDAILQTHSHPDHVSSAAGLARRTGARGYAHSLDARHRGESGEVLHYMAPLPFLERTLVDQTIEDRDVIPMLGGI